MEEKIKCTVTVISKPASRAFRPGHHRRLSRWRSQAIDAPQENPLRRQLPRRVPHLPQSNCKVSVNSTSGRVFIDATILGGAAGSVIYGTITDPATGAQVNFTSSGLSAITGVGKISFSGLITGGINALSHGLTVSGYAVSVGYRKGAGNAGAGPGSITLTDYSGANIGKLDADFAGVSPSAGAFGVGITGVFFAADYGRVSYSKPGC